MKQHCARCELDIPLDAYHPGKRGKTGSYCRSCCNEYKRDRRPTREVPQHTVFEELSILIRATPCRLREQSTTYQAVHKRIRRERGPASEHVCARCGQQARDWAYDHTDPNELTTQWYGKTVAYSPDVDHYVPLCRLCHYRMDNRYEGSALQKVNEQRKLDKVNQMQPDPMPRPVTQW